MPEFPSKKQSCLQASMLSPGMPVANEDSSLSIGLTHSGSSRSILPSPSLSRPSEHCVVPSFPPSVAPPAPPFPSVPPLPVTCPVPPLPVVGRPPSPRDNPSPPPIPEAVLPPLPPAPLAPPFDELEHAAVTSARQALARIR